MVTLNQQLPRFEDRSINLEEWSADKLGHYTETKQENIKRACQLSRIAGESQATPYGESCFEQGLRIANILLELKLDADTITSAIICSSAQYADLSADDIEEHLGKEIADLTRGVIKMGAMSNAQFRNQNPGQANNLRKMLLAMVADVRVVLIKLAERICIMRAIKFLKTSEAKLIAQETKDIYAPLANRLGIAQMKWELEDLCFFYLYNDEYKSIAKLLNEKRLERDARIDLAQHEINLMLEKANIKATVSGRSKHIYSIHAKMMRKNVSYHEIYDASALRITVDSIEDCYAILGAIHAKWAHVPEEFDDYISNPKPNGYQSIHTVIIGPKDKHIEIQIRTHKMHEEAELGVAAHWVYKEGKHNEGTGYEEKIVRLRQLLDWHKEIAHTDEKIDQFHDEIFEDRVYVFTPDGDIVDLQKGATPLDFAYRIHSSIGHRCRGAKIDNRIVPLTYVLNTGDTVSVLTSKTGSPSRDWLNPHLGYLVTSRARAKVQHWFNNQDQEKHIEIGHDLLDRELNRLSLKNVNLKKVADTLQFKTTDAMFASLGKGRLRLAQIINLIHEEEPKDEILTTLRSPTKSSSKGITIEGVGNLLTHIATCCKPVIGDDIIGYITQGRGVSIHRKSCSNITHLSEHNQHRLIEVSWGLKANQQFSVDVAILADDRPNLLRDITTMFSNEKINLTSLSSQLKNGQAEFRLTLEISDLSQLSRLLEKLNQLPNIHEAKRMV